MTTTYRIKRSQSNNDLIQYIQRSLEVEDWCENDFDLFVFELADIGIVTVQDFHDRFRYASDHTSPYEDYVWFYYLTNKSRDLELFSRCWNGLVFDWERIWISSLSLKHDFFYFHKAHYFFSVKGGTDNGSV